MSVLERCPAYREFSYSKVTEKRQGPTPGVRLIELSIKREFVVFVPGPVIGLIKDLVLSPESRLRK